MIRKIIHIDEEKCNGCGLCAAACHEGAIDIVDGKAKLVRENFCDGFGDCLPNCPTGAITFEEREAPEYDHEAVQKAQEARKMNEMKHEHSAGGCPGSRMMRFKQNETESAPVSTGKPVSRLAQWPCQIKLVPTQAPFFDGAKLLIAADCTAYAYANMQEEFMRGKVTIIGCPKLDDVDYTEKLTAIIRDNNIRSVTMIQAYNQKALSDPVHPRATYKDPSALLIICANATMAYTTKAGVHVIPIGCLRD